MIALTAQQIDALRDDLRDVIAQMHDDDTDAHNVAPLRQNVSNATSAYDFMTCYRECAYDCESACAALCAVVLDTNVEGGAHAHAVLTRVDTDERTTLTTFLRVLFDDARFDDNFAQSFST